MVAPEFSDAASSFHGDVNFGTVNVLKEVELIEALDITGVPMFGYWDSADGKTMAGMKLASHEDLEDATDIADFAEGLRVDDSLNDLMLAQLLNITEALY